MLILESILLQLVESRTNWKQRFATSRKEPTLIEWSETRTKNVFCTFDVTLVPRVGLEHGQKTTEKTRSEAEGGAESGALGGEFDPPDPNLAEVVKAWAILPEAVRENILAIVRAAQLGETDRP